METRLGMVLECIVSWYPILTMDCIISWKHMKLWRDDGHTSRGREFLTIESYRVSTFTRIRPALGVSVLTGRQL